MDPVQLIMDRLEEQQKVIEEMQAALARQAQERDAAILSSMMAAVAELQQAGQQAGPSMAEAPQPAQPQELAAELAAEQVRPAGDPDSLRQWIERFNAQNPPSFTGTLNVQVAEDWITRLEKIFTVLECSSERKAQMAIYKLEGEADRWWKNTEMILQENATPITWEVFKEHFNSKYFPLSVRDEMEAEFLRIQQGPRESFDEYLDRYMRLSRYSNYLQLRNDERWKTEKMVRGLRQELREKVAPRQLEKFDQAVEACRITESCLNHQVLARTAPRPEGTSSRGNRKRRKPMFFKKSKRGGGVRQGGM